MKIPALTALFICTCFFTFSCSKDDPEEKEPEVPRCRLTKVTQGLDPATDTIKMFKYNAEGMPVQMSEEGDRGTVFWWNFVYKPGTVQLEKIAAELDMSYVFTSFEYNAQGRLSKINSHLGHEFSYQYNTGGVLTRIDCRRFGTPESYYVATTFDNNGNLVKAERKRVSNDEVLDTDVIEYTDLPNTLTGLSVLNIGNALGMNSLFKSSYWVAFSPKYLIKSAKTNPDKEVNSSYEYVYERDAAGNVTKAVVTITHQGIEQPGSVFTWNFEYDCD